jgi:putative FmdB family regulatory protein
MPIYEYKCSKCGENFEVLQKFSDKPVATHEGCGGTVKRLLSPPGLHFKGSGWYVTDYAKSGSRKGEAKPKSETVAPAAKTDGSTTASSSSTPAPAKS